MAKLLSQKRTSFAEVAPVAPDDVGHIRRSYPKECRNPWEVLHRRALEADLPDEEFLAKFRMMVPCGECRMHWDAMVARTIEPAQEYFRWTVERHNEVNEKLGKPVLTIEEARSIWQGEAKSGS